MLRYGVCQPVYVPKNSDQFRVRLQFFGQFSAGGRAPTGMSNWGQIRIDFDVQGAFGLLACFWGLFCIEAGQLP